MLAVLTAGAAYVPLDPCTQDRLSMILQDARPVLMIAKRGHWMPGGVPDVRTVFLDDEAPTRAIRRSARGCRDRFKRNGVRLVHLRLDWAAEGGGDLSACDVILLASTAC